MILSAIVAPATASLPILARIRIKKIQELVATNICPTPPMEVIRIFPIIGKFNLILERETFICFPAFTNVHSCTKTPVPLPMFVAIPAPSIPNSGIGPHPKIRIGSNTILTPFA